MSKPVEDAWQEFGSELRGFIRSRVRDHAAAEDILQDTFLKLQKHVASVRSSERIGPWLFQVARRAIADHFRSARPGEELPEELPAAPLEKLPDLSKSVRRMVESLPKPYREALLLTEWEGVPQTALAQRLGVSVSAVKSRVQRGRAQLRELLLACCRFEFDRRGNIVDAEPRSDDCIDCEE
jgi:RNA polymerase sigma-70 factor, ECF subfamily